ncbi:Hypothetical protein SAMN06295912_11945 [Sphingomonas laterariae]|uniref:DUF2271 domain-containing protein n=1 Tax=Edaphosphingomonas laterariae TaxID=861865 RepID=A0A239HUM4_9SPHN|nr:DUF2271 domain-containing protein [Sphingomonas laterariae]SNS85100.1 Hypothetical protein SAMN06295912_11945 [Sphingomonas laterariae]
MRTVSLSLATTATLAATPAAAAGIDVTVNIPQLKVAEYHRPYVAMWIEQAGQPAAHTVAVWYDDDMKANEGTKWLRDMRTWWRKSGRTMKFPAAGISGATRAPGPQKASFTAGKGGLPNLAPGNYVLFVEAAREVGGRELLQLPFAWPPKPGQTVRAAGKTELGQVVATFKP